IEQFFQTSLASRMLQAERVEREVPFTFIVHAEEVYPDWEANTDEKVLIQGVIDCILYEANGISIIDYKTDTIVEDVISEEVIASLRERYEVQVQLYKRALESILRQKVKDTHLYFFQKDILITL